MWEICLNSEQLTFCYQCSKFWLHLRGWHSVGWLWEGGWEQWVTMAGINGDLLLKHSNIHHPKQYSSSRQRLCQPLYCCTVGTKRKVDRNKWSFAFHWDPNVGISIQVLTLLDNLIIWWTFSINKDNILNSNNVTSEELLLFRNRRHRQRHNGPLTVVANLATRWRLW